MKWLLLVVDLVVVDVEVIGSAEDSDERWEARRLGFPVHPIAGVLRLVRPNNTQETVVLQKFTACRVTEKTNETKSKYVSFQAIF